MMNESVGERDLAKDLRLNEIDLLQGLHYKDCSEQFPHKRLDAEYRCGCCGFVTTESESVSVIDTVV